MHRPLPIHDDGFTLLEVAMTVALMGTVMAFAVSGWQGWTRAAAQDAFAEELVSVMRLAQQRAVATGTSMCVDFDAAAETWEVLKGACDGDPEALESTRTAPTGLDIVDPRFDYYDYTQPDALTQLDGVTFEPTGQASSGDVHVVREDGTRIRIVVKGLSGRVAIR